ncbi:MAG: CHAT domain-containing protein [Cytophagales bacterium]
MSLWTVDDLATKDLMIAFYTNLVQSKNKRQSLRDAQLQMLKKYKFPYYWAPFVMVGE